MATTTIVSKKQTLSTPPIPADLPGVELTENARQVLVRRYVRRGDDGNPAETIEEMFWRVAYHIAKAEESYGGDVLVRAREFYVLLTSRKFFPNSPTFTGAGTPLGQLAACFTGGMRVTTSQGVKRIETLAIGDQVLTHAGHYRPITQLFRRAYDGELLRIRVRLIGTTMEVTPEHPILTEKGWVKAGELRIGDRVAIGVPKGTRISPHFDLAESEYEDELELQANGTAVQVRRPSSYQDSGRQVEWVYRHIEGTPDLACLCGDYVAEETIGPDARTLRNIILRDNEQVYFEIEAITSQNFIGVVYNCEVDEDHTYVTEGVVVHNCFVLPITDDMGRDPAGIFQSLRDAALIQQTGGGNGFSFSRLRPKGSLVKSSAGQATGPVGFLRVYDHAFGEIAQGGCLLPETLVFTENGLLRLDELVDMDKPGWQANSLQVATDEGLRLSPHAYNNGVAKVMRVHTKEGLSLAGTPEHKVKVMSDEGPVWRALSDLRSGDWLLVQLGQHRGKLQALGHPERSHGNQDWPHLSPILDEELAFFIGYLIGDGFVASREDDHRVGVSVSHTSYLIEDMPALMERLFGVTIHTQQKPEDRSVTLVMDNRAVKDFLQLNGLIKSRSISAVVPRLIRQSPANIVGAFLRGLFEADGAVSHGYPALTTTSSHLVEQVSTLLIGLGCPVRVHTIAPSSSHYGKNEVYFVRVNSNAGLQVWRERVGCDPRSRFAACMAWVSDLVREKSFILPNASYWLDPVLESITLEQVDRQHRGLGKKFRSENPPLRRSLLRYLRGERHLTRSAVDELTLAYPAFAAHAISLEGKWFVQVSDVQDEGQALTLDLEVQGNHTYLANGMVTHNSRRGANMGVLRVDHPDIEEFINCKTNENQITNFNISVGITDAFMQAVKNDADWDLVFPDVAAPEYRGFSGTPEQAKAKGIPLRTYKTVRAGELFAKIVKQAHHNGEPGLLFLDAANRSNPVPHLYPLEATNPCVTGETLVATPSGWKRADAIKEGDEICTVLGVGRVATVEANENMPVYDLHLSDGARVRVTASHQFQARDSRTKFFEQRRLDQLNEGDWIRVYRASIPSNEVPGRPENISQREYGFLVGVLVGDGCYTPHALSKHVVRISSHADEYEWNEILTNAFTKIGAEKMSTYVNEGSRSMMMDPKPGGVIANWVISLPLAPARGPEKQLPDVYINSNREFLEGLLDGLFSTDGSVDLQSNHPLVRFHTSSIELARQLRRILLMFGIYARINPSQRARHEFNDRAIRHDRPKHDVTISGESFGRFFEQIHLSHPAKQMRMEEAAINTNFTGSNWAAKVVKIEPAGRATVYDIYEPRSDTWITEGFVSRGCGEQWLGPYENCCLGSVNLAEHCGADGQVDWDGLRRSVESATRFLDDVVDANAYVPAVPQLKEAAYRARRIGLGIMGLADMMYHVGVRYGSPNGQGFGAQVMEFVRYHAVRTSVALARERGAFPSIKGSIYDFEEMQWQPPRPLTPYTGEWGRPALDWDGILEGIQKYGIRNAAQTTVAPTGTIATVAGCEGYGCEPVFALAYVRHVNDNGKDLQLTYASPRFDAALEKAGITGDARQDIIQRVMQHGTCQDIPEVPEPLRNVFVVAGDIPAEDHVHMQAALQAFVDNSLSKTINFPEDASPEDVAEAYLLAWELGCKGITVYVTGSREKVVLETKATAQKKQAAPVPTGTVVMPFGNNGGGKPVSETEIATQLAAWHESKKPRPRLLPGSTFRVETPLGKAFITVNENGGKQPFEVFINTAKAGSETAAISEAIGRLVSYILRLASPIAARERLSEVVRQLSGIGGSRSLGFGPNRVRSLPDGVGQVLDEYLNGRKTHQVTGSDAKTDPQPADDDEHSTQVETAVAAMKMGDLCPECGEATMVNEEGCRKCYTCGYSEC